MAREGINDQILRTKHLLIEPKLIARNSTIEHIMGRPF